MKKISKILRRRIGKRIQNTFLRMNKWIKHLKKCQTRRRQYFLELKQFHQADYLQRGQIRPLSEYIRELMKWLKPGIPTQTQEIQQLLHDKLLAKARTKSELRERGEIPEEKPKMKRIQTTYMGPSTIEEKKDDGTIVIKVLPDKDIYEDLVHEEDEVIDMTAMESASEEDPDEESADDLSIVTVDSLANIDKEQDQRTLERDVRNQGQGSKYLQQAVKHGGRNVSSYYSRDNQ